MSHGTITPGLIDYHVHLSDAGLADASVQDRDPSGLRPPDGGACAPHARGRLHHFRDVGGRDHLEFALRRARGLPVAEPRQTKNPWTPRYFARRVGWHVLDHAWEIEDRAIRAG